jgi:hypothetical protein
MPANGRATEAASVQSSQPLTIAELRTLALASLGGALEFYDFIIFVFFTAVIGKLFFSASLPDWMRQLQTFGLFSAGYLARPLGGLGAQHLGSFHWLRAHISVPVMRPGEDPIRRILSFRSDRDRLHMRSDARQSRRTGPPVVSSRRGRLPAPI